MTCDDCGMTAGWECTCSQHECPCGARYSDYEIPADHPDLCPTCAELCRMAEAKGTRVEAH